MKKVVVSLLVLGSVSMSALADNFEGLGVGFGVSSTRIDDDKSKSPFLQLSYGAVRGNLVATPVVKLNFEHNDASNESSTGVGVSAGLALGYKIGKVLPYLKADYGYARAEYSMNGVKESGHVHGAGYGGGVKYTVLPNFEVGAEYMRKRLKASKDSEKVKASEVTLGVDYRF